MSVAGGVAHAYAPGMFKRLSLACSAGVGPSAGRGDPALRAASASGQGGETDVRCARPVGTTARGVAAASGPAPRCVVPVGDLTGAAPRDFPAAVAMCEQPPRLAGLLPVGDGTALLRRAARRSPGRTQPGRRHGPHRRSNSRPLPQSVAGPVGQLGGLPGKIWKPGNAQLQPGSADQLDATQYRGCPRSHRAGRGGHPGCRCPLRRDRTDGTARGGNGARCLRTRAERHAALWPREIKVPSSPGRRAPSMSTARPVSWKHWMRSAPWQPAKPLWQRPLPCWQRIKSPYSWRWEVAGKPMKSS